MKQQSANDHFGSSNGTEQYYRHPFANIVFTDGVKDLAYTCGAYWLIDLIASHQLSKKVQAEAFQVWKLEQVTADGYIATCEDGNSNKVASQTIPFSDFPYQQATLWLTEGVLMLPREY